MNKRHMKAAVLMLALILVSLAIANTARARLWNRAGTTIYYNVDRACTDGMILSVADMRDTPGGISFQLFGDRLMDDAEVLAVSRKIPEGPIEIPGAGLAPHSGSFELNWNDVLQPGTRVRLQISVDEPSISITDIFTTVHNCRLADTSKLPVRHLFGRNEGARLVPPLPDSGSAACRPGLDVTSSELTVLEDVVIDDLNVAFYLNDDSDRTDLEVILTSPEGTAVTLIARDTPGGRYSFGTRCNSVTANLVGEDMADFILDDGSEFDLLIPATPEHHEASWQPTGPGSLSDFAGENAAGTWTLDVCDTTKDLDQEATLSCWYLEILNYPAVSFVQDTVEVNEGAGMVAIEVALSETSADYVEATYTTIPEPGSNQVATSGTVKFAPRTASDPGQKKRTISIPIIDDAVQEADETMLIKLSDPTNQYSIGDLGEAAIKIRDNDKPGSASLTINITGSGSVAKVPDKVVYDIGETVTLTAVPEPGYVFDGWGGALSGTQNPQALLMGGDRTVTATFIQEASPAEDLAFLPALEIIPGQDWKTGVQAQNGGAVSAPISLTAYDAAGQALPCGAVDTPPGGSANFLSYRECPPPHPLLGSGVLSAEGQPLSSVVMMNNSNAQGSGLAGASYTGMSADVTAKTLFFPLVKHDHNGRTTAFSVQNTGDTANDITAVFRVNGEEYTKNYDDVPPFTSVLILPADATVPAGFGQVGSLTVSGTSPLAGASLEHEHDVSIAQNLQASTAFTPADFDSTLFCPLVRNGHSAKKLTSGVQVQNVSTAAQTISFTYTPVDGGANIIRSQSVAPGASATFYAPTVGIPAGSLGAVTLQGSDGIVAVVNERGVLPSGQVLQSTYACFAAQGATDSILIPLYKEFYKGNTTGIQVQNVSGDGRAATVTLEYQASGPGDLNGQATFSHRTPVADGASITFWGVSDLPGGSDLFVASGDAGSLRGTFGSVVISSDQPVVAIVNEASYGANGGSKQDSKSYEGFNGD